jgi:hypothetical protein
MGHPSSWQGGFLKFSSHAPSKATEGNLLWSAADKFIRPGDEIFHVGRIGMTAIVLPPRELAIEKTDMDWRHFFRVVVAGDTKRRCTEQLKDRLRGYSGHVAALVIEPLGIALFRNAIAHKHQPRRAQGDQLG